MFKRLYIMSLNIGKREFSRHPLKYLKLALEQDIVINHRGHPEVEIRKYNNNGNDQTLENKYRHHAIDKVISKVVAND